MTFVQVEAATFLVSEKSLDMETKTVPIAGFLDTFQVGDQLERVKITFLPPGHDGDGAVGFLSEGHRGHIQAVAWR